MLGARGVNASLLFVFNPLFNLENWDSQMSDVKTTLFKVTKLAATRNKHWLQLLIVFVFFYFQWPWQATALIILPRITTTKQWSVCNQRKTKNSICAVIQCYLSSLRNQGSDGEEYDQVTFFPLYCCFSVLTTLTVSQTWTLTEFNLIFTFAHGLQSLSCTLIHATLTGEPVWLWPQRPSCTSLLLALEHT